jgi:4-hydroxybenzoate polyprenyltransferase
MLDTRKEQIMRILLFILATLAFLVGASIFTAAESAVHEIEAFILFLISAVFISGAGVVEAVNLLRKEMASLRGQANKQ